MFLVAITGGIATGKSTVAKIFKEHGIPVIDADLIARQVVEPGKPAWEKIKKVFGDSIINKYNEINREALGKIVFNDVKLRHQLNEITHPVIHRTIIFEVFKMFMSGENYVVMDLPLLFETGILMDFIHKIITVTCNEEIQTARLIKRSSLTEEEAKKRIASQMPLEQKCAKSHFVIENSNDHSRTEEEVLKILTILNSSKHHWKIRSYLFVGCVTLLGILFWLNYMFNFISFNNN